MMGTCCRKWSAESARWDQVCHHFLLATPQRKFAPVFYRRTIELMRVLLAVTPTHDDHRAARGTILASCWVDPLPSSSNALHSCEQQHATSCFAAMVALPRRCPLMTFMLAVDASFERIELAAAVHLPLDDLELSAGPRSGHSTWRGDCDPDRGSCLRTPL